MKKLVIIALFFIVSLVGAQDYVPEFESEDCPYFMQEVADGTNTDIYCGNLLVPENRSNIDNSLELELFVVRIEPIQDSNHAPFVYLEGGPGGAASASFEFWLESSIHRDYDIILIDQRGTGLSYPSLNCYEVDEVDDESWVEDCRDRLTEDENIDLDAYNSANNANDIHDLLVALGIEEANIYGSSYGTRLALTMMRDFSDRIGTVIIDAVYPPHVDSLASEAVYGNQAIQQLFEDCLANSACNASYPQLRQSFYSAIETMNDKTPLIYDYELDYLVETSGDDFVNLIFSFLYDTEMLQYLPALIDAYADGDYEYDPQFEAEDIAFQQSTDPIEPDEYDFAAMDYLDIDDIDELYDHYDSLDDDEFYDLFDELETHAYYMKFRDYLGYDSIDEVADYLDSLDDNDFYELEAEVTGLYDSDSEGMFFSVECSEEIHFNNENDVLAQSEEIPELIRTPLTDTSINSISDCNSWDVAESGEIENQPVISDIPTLVLSGVYDPVTPYQWGEEAQSYLPNSWHYIFPNVGHGALDTQDCANLIVLSFLEQPLQQPYDSCIDGVLAPDFYIRP
jgi:pimeloyl-ACP methyl ester carboxylesterase